MCHMCRFGMKVEGLGGRADLVLKPTGWLTNGWPIGREVATRCNISHAELDKEQCRHVAIKGGRIASKCEVYPTELCKAVIRGLRRQLEEDGAMDRWGVGAINQIWGGTRQSGGRSVKTEQAHMIRAMKDTFGMSCLQQG